MTSTRIFASMDPAFFNTDPEPWVHWATGERSSNGFVGTHTYEPRPEFTPVVRHPLNLILRDFRYNYDPDEYSWAVLDWLPDLRRMWEDRLEEPFPVPDVNVGPPLNLLDPMQGLPALFDQLAREAMESAPGVQVTRGNPYRDQDSETSLVWTADGADEDIAAARRLVADMVWHATWVLVRLHAVSTAA